MSAGGRSPLRSLRYELIQRLFVLRAQATGMSASTTIPPLPDFARLPRLIHIAAATHGDVISQQLQRND